MVIDVFLVGLLKLALGRCSLPRGAVGFWGSCWPPGLCPVPALPPKLLSTRMCNQGGHWSGLFGAYLQSAYHIAWDEVGIEHPGPNPRSQGASVFWGEKIETKRSFALLHWCMGISVLSTFYNKSAG